VDDRGIFVEAFNTSKLWSAGIKFDIVMMNLSKSDQAGTIRGMHWQNPPFEQGKIVFSASKRIFDAIVDIRPGSESYGKIFHVDLYPQTNALLVPRGVAHGCQALEDGAMLTYLLDNLYSPPSEKGLRYDDPEAQIPWPLPPVNVAGKDLKWPSMKEIAAEWEKT
jgi:dTDP-4-dehydrorhamnose 3,5-epimerase